MPNLFASHGEKIYFLFTVCCMLLSIAFSLFCTYGKSNLAQTMRHRRRINVATLSLRLNVPLYVLTLSIVTWVYVAIFVHLGWYASMSLGLVGSIWIGIRYCIALTDIRSDKAALAEASLFMDYDIRMPQIRFKVRTR